MSKYLGQLKTYGVKFKNLDEKFNAILEENKDNKDKEIFARSLINPNKALGEKEKEELETFIKKFCAPKKMQSEIAECKEVTNLKGRPVILEEALTYVKSGLIDSTDIQDKGMSHDDYQTHLTDLLEGAMEETRNSKKQPHIAAMNGKVKDFRVAAFSLKTEFQKYQAADNTMNFGTSNKTVKETYDAEFAKSGEGDTIKNTWSGESDQNQALVVRQDLNKVSIHKLNLSTTEHSIDSPEAIDGLNKKAYYHYVGKIGAMQVIFIKDIGLKYFVDAVCSLKTQTLDFNESLEDHLAFRKVKYFVSNYKKIFNGLESDYSNDINDAFREMTDITISEASQIGAFNLKHFYAGINRVLEIVSYVEQQHPDWKQTGIRSVESMCPQLLIEMKENVPLLGDAPTADTNSDSTSELSGETPQGDL